MLFLREQLAASTRRDDAKQGRRQERRAVMPRYPAVTPLPIVIPNEVEGSRRSSMDATRCLDKLGMTA
jgi:hypothetical protein